MRCLRPDTARRERTGRGVEAKSGAEAQRAPAGTTVGAPGLGALPYFSFQDISISDDTVLRVNLGNGNLLVTSNDESIAAPGIGLRSDRFYNGLSDLDGDFGGGWHSSLSTENIGLFGSGWAAPVPNTSVTFWGPTGIRIAFTWDGTKYVTAPGFKATLTTAATVPSDPAVGYYTITYNSTGERIVLNSYGWLLSDKDRNNVGLTYSYPGTNLNPVITDAAGRQIYVTLAAGSTASYSRWENIADSAGRETNYAQTAAGQLGTVTKPDGEVTKYSYDSTGRLKTISLGADPADPKVTFGYDTAHRVTSIAQTTEAAGVTGSDAITTFTYTAGQTKVKDPRTNESTFAIDSSGRVTSATDPLGRPRSQTWTANSDVATSNDAFAAANVTTRSYDTIGNNTGVTLPTGAAASAAYAVGTACPTAGAGNIYLPKCTTDAAGNKAAYTYDAAGNTTQIADTTAGGTGAVPQKYTYDTAARTLCGGFAGQVCTSVDGNAKTTSYAYDTAGNLVTVTPPAPLGATTYTYDAVGRVSTVTDPLADTTRYTYDAADRLYSTVTADGHELEQYTNPQGFVAATCDIQVRCDLFDGDSQGRTITADHYAGAPTLPNFRSWESYGYDPAGNLTTMWTSSTSSLGPTTYTYDTANQLTKTQQPGGTCPATGAPAANSGCVIFTYNVNGLEATRTTPGGAHTDTTRDNSGRPTRITAKTGTGTTAVDIGYSYTVAGADRTAIQTRTSYAEQGITAGAITTYEYDSLNRLKTAVEKSGATTTASWTYAYDNAGNRTSQIRVGSTGATAGTIGYTYNAANQIATTTADTTAWTYDAAGNQTKNGITGVTATYGDRGQTTTIGATAITSLGIGNSTRITAGTRSFTDNALGLDSQSIGSATTTYSNSSKGGAIGYNAAAAHYYISDLLGSVVGMFSATGTYEGGYSYSPYGETRFTGTATAVTGNTQRYIGGYQEAANLYKLGARYYDSALGRFTQMDPSGQEVNPYSYAAGDPVGNKDPSGLSLLSVAIDIISAILAGKSLGDALAGVTRAQALGILAGGIFAVGCAAAVAAVGVATFGIGLLAGLGCAVIVQTATTAVESLFTL